MRSLTPELILLIEARERLQLAWVPCTSPYSLKSHQFERAEWVRLVRDLESQGLLEKFKYLLRRGHHRGYQQSLTCYRITRQGQELLKELKL